MMFKSYYEVIYNYYFGDIVFIPVLPMLFVYIPIFIFQVLYQAALIYELILKKFITKKFNFLFILPIILIIITLNRSPYDNFKEYPLPNFKIQELMFKIQTKMEEYRVETKYYPKAENRFNEKITNKISKKLMITDYTIKRNKVKLKTIYVFDQTGPYIKNIKKYTAPAIVVTVGSSGKKYWITAIIKSNYIDGKDIVLNYNGKPFILKEEILIRDRLRNHENSSVIYNQLINGIKK